MKNGKLIFGAIGLVTGSFYLGHTAGLKKVSKLIASDEFANLLKTEFKKIIHDKVTTASEETFTDLIDEFNEWRSGHVES